jgi:16S rRNA (cytosine1402-N4)-methyltransferase
MTSDPGRLHEPVMRERVVQLLAPALRRADSVLVDATLGMGGHAEALLAACPTARLIGIDRDPQALSLAAQRLAAFASRVELVHATSDTLVTVLQGLGLRVVNAVLLDLGVSSLQLDRPERGFAYAQDAELDMRMDQSAGITAAQLLAAADEAELARILRRYGEERFAARIAGAIVRERARAPITTSAQLVDLVRASIPAAARRTGGNPAKRTFQALRIAVNDELGVLSRTMGDALSVLDVGGRIVVLAYHSLEDRIVKRALAEQARSTAPPGLPVELPEHAPRLRLLTRGAETASPEEVSANPRAASVRLRAAERIARAGAGRDAA